MVSVTCETDLMCSQRCLARWVGRLATPHSTRSHPANAGAPHRLVCQAHRYLVYPRTAALAQKTDRSMALAEPPGNEQEVRSAACLSAIDLLCSGKPLSTEDGAASSGHALCGAQ